MSDFTFDTSSTLNVLLEGNNTEDDNISIFLLVDILDSGFMI